jgi:hypothetical protein
MPLSDQSKQTQQTMTTTQTSPPCDCGNTKAQWYGEKNSRREYMCEKCHFQAGNHHDNMTTKQIESVNLVLNHKNWTGVPLRDLIDLGRVYHKDRPTITAFVREVHGEPTSVDQLTKQRAIVNAIMERGAA